jgi:arylformamidase
LYDISIAVAPNTPEWPGDTPFSCNWSWRIADGDSVNVSSVSGSPHVGTHADAPLHVKDGWPSSEELPLESFAGRAVVWSVPGDSLELSRQVIAPLLSRRIARLLLRTGRSIGGGSFPDAWPALTPDAAEALMDDGLLLLGVDAPSVDWRESKTLAVHQAILGRGGCVLENLNLANVPDGEYELVAYPVKMQGLDAAPVRAVLRDLR